MRRLIVLFLIVFIVVSTIFLIEKNHDKNTTKQVNNIYQPPDSRGELYQDIYISLLMPYIEKEVASYYSNILKETPQVAPYYVNVLDAKRPNGYRSFLFELKLKVIPYVGPHIGVGVDYITIKIASRKVTIENFKHINTYSLPPNYQHLLINVDRNNNNG